MGENEKMARQLGVYLCNKYSGNLGKYAICPALRRGRVRVGGKGFLRLQQFKEFDIWSFDPFTLPLNFLFFVGLLKLLAQ